MKKRKTDTSCCCWCGYGGILGSEVEVDGDAVSAMLLLPLLMSDESDEDESNVDRLCDESSGGGLIIIWSESIFRYYGEGSSSRSRGLLWLRRGGRRLRLGWGNAQCMRGCIMVRESASPPDG